MCARAHEEVHRRGRGVRTGHSSRTLLFLFPLYVRARFMLGEQHPHSRGPAPPGGPTSSITLLLDPFRVIMEESERRVRPSGEGWRRGEEGQRRGEVESEGGRRKKGRGVGSIHWPLWPPALCLCFSLSIPVGFLTDSLDACTSCDVKDTQETVKRGRGGGRRGKRTVVRLNV